MAFSKNTYYRFLNDPGYNWQRFLTLLSARVIAYFSSLTHTERVKCLVLDDSVIERNRRKQVEHRTFFRSSKSLLCLGSEFQGLSYDMTVSSTAIVFTRYILLEWLRRKTNAPKTICELFYVCCDDIQNVELCMALSSLVAIFVEGLRTEAVKITNAVKTQRINWFVSQPAFNKALFPETVWEV